MIRVDVRVADDRQTFHRLSVMLAGLSPKQVLVTMDPPAAGPEVELSFLYPEGPEQAVGLSEDIITRMAEQAGFTVLAARGHTGCDRLEGRVR